MMKQFFMYPYNWVILVIGLVLLLLAILYLARRYGDGAPRENTSIDILKERYARGEITREDFERMKKDLE